MKKFICCLLLVLCLCITGCGESYDMEDSETYSSTWIKCQDYEFLYYDSNTKVVYYIFYDIGYRRGFGYMSPYLSENGYFCKWNDNRIVEIKN